MPSMKVKGRFRNFMTYSRQWAEEIGSEDAHGRALWSLGKAVVFLHNPGHLAMSATLFNKAVTNYREIPFAPRYRLFPCGNTGLPG